MYVCLCKGLTESDVRRLAQSSGREAEALSTALGLEDDDCCGRCARNIEQLVGMASGAARCGTCKRASV